MKNVFSILLLFFIMIKVSDASIVIPIALIDEKNTPIGIVTADNTIYGLLLTPHLHDLPPGVHGFHIHELPFCGNQGVSAGGHYDPDKTLKHRGPYHGDGHFGDLPVLIVDEKGHATLPVLAPRLRLADIRERSLVIDFGGDNYQDKPIKLGGGGARIACGVIPYF